MAKQKKNIKQRSVKESFFSKFNLDDYIPRRFQTAALIGIILILFMLFFNPLYFGNKTFQTGDIVQIEAAKKYAEQEREGYSLWMPYIFGGMPAYAVGTEPKWFNLLYDVQYFVREVIIKSLLSVDHAKWSIYLILLSITSFFLMRYLTKNNLVSFFTAVSTGFCTGLVVFLYIGHVTKLLELFIYPAIFLLLFKMQNKIKLLDTILLIIFLHLAMQGFHAQIIFYILFAVAVYYIYFFLRALIKKEKELRTNILKSSGVFIISAGIAVAMQADDLTQIYEYTPYSTRGTESIVDKAKDTDTDYYQYHTDWSFSPEEVLTFIVPSFYGFGNSTYKGSLSNNESINVNTYFGQMRFVDVAMYMGVLVFFLALFAIFADWKNPYVRFLTILSGIALLISFGRNFPILFDLFFYNLPYFNKFRVPSMILVLVQLNMPVLAGFGLMKIISLRNEKNLKLSYIFRNIAIILLGIFIIVVLFNSSLSDSFGERLVKSEKLGPSIQYYNQYGINLVEIAKKMYSSDLIFAFGFSTFIFLMAYIYIKQKISADFLVFIAITLTVIDLWRIDARGAKYEDNPDIETLFREPGYITAIKNQEDKEPFRMLNLKQDNTYGSFSHNANFNAYFFVEDLYGYSGIKPRAFQDIMDVVGPANPTLWRMMNVKYIILGNPVQMAGLKPIFTSEKSYVYENENVLPRAYLVNKVEKKTEIEFLNMVKSSSFDPHEIAFVHDINLKVDPTDSTAYSKITGYLEDKIDVEVNASGNNFFFFSSTYLPGWKAMIDGKETQTYKANHGYIGIIVPKGKHQVRFTYAPESFYLSRNIALILSSLVVFGLMITIFLEVKKRNKNQAVQVIAKD